MERMDSEGECAGDGMENRQWRASRPVYAFILQNRGVGLFAADRREIR